MPASPNNWFIDLGLAPSPAVILDERGKIAFVNQAWRDSAGKNGYRGVGFIGIDYAAFCDRVVGTERAQAQAVAEAVRELGAGEREQFEITYPCHSPEEKRWFKCVAFRHGGHVVVSHVDVSQECRADDAARPGIASDVLKSNQLFHDLRAPLTTIIGYAQACQTYPDEKLIQVREGHALIEQAGGRMLDIVNDVMALFQDAQDCAPMTETPVQLAALIGEILDRNRTQARALNMTLDHDIRDDLVLLGDERKLWRLFDNLCGNAVKYNVPDGRVVVSATLNASIGLVVHVRDTGVGIAEDRQDAVFSPFERVATGEDWQGREGVGLGLAIVREQCDRHDATIELDSRPGEGSTFTVVFPSWRTVRKTRAKAAPDNPQKRAAGAKGAG